MAELQTKKEQKIKQDDLNMKEKNAKRLEGLQMMARGLGEKRDERF